MKADIIRKTFFVARDKEGNEYPLMTPDGVRVECKNVEGELITETEQDQYEDGSYARSYTEITYFKIKKS